jgi:hypothetical protein
MIRDGCVYGCPSSAQQWQPGNHHHAGSNHEAGGASGVVQKWCQGFMWLARPMYMTPAFQQSVEAVLVMQICTTAHTRCEDTGPPSDTDHRVTPH